MRAGLDAAGYDETSPCARLGCTSWMEISGWGRTALRHRLRDLEPRLSVLLELFAVGTGVPTGAASAALGQPLLQACADTGLIALDGGNVRALVSLASVQNLRFASDPFELHRAGAPDFVLGPGGVTRRLADPTLRRRVERAVGHLSERGTLQMLAEWPERDGSEWTTEVASWLDGSGCDAWVLRTYTNGARDYAMRWLMQEHGGLDVPENGLDGWVSLAGLGVHAVGGGLIVLRRATSARRPTQVIRDAPPITPPAGPSLQRWLDAHGLSRASSRTTTCWTCPSFLPRIWCAPKARARRPRGGRRRPRSSVSTPGCASARGSIRWRQSWSVTSTGSALRAR